MNALARLKQGMALIDALTLRERAMVLAGALAVLYFAWDFLLMQPLAAEHQAVLNQLELSNTELIALNDELESLDPARSEQLARTKREQLARIKEESTNLEHTLANTMTHLVPPGEMTSLLEMVLQRTQGLELRKVTGLGSTAVEIGAGTGPRGTNVPTTARDVAKLFRHGLSIEFSGDFYTTLSYLQQLEGLQWKFFWESIDFKVGEYPASVSTISIFTLSMNDRWIGD